MSIESQSETLHESRGSEWQKTTYDNWLKSECQTTLQRMSIHAMCWSTCGALWDTLSILFSHPMETVEFSPSQTSHSSRSASYTTITDKMSIRLESVRLFITSFRTFSRRLVQTRSNKTDGQRETSQNPLLTLCISWKCVWLEYQEDRRLEHLWASLSFVHVRRCQQPRAEPASCPLAHAAISEVKCIRRDSGIGISVFGYVWIPFCFEML